MGFSGRPVLFFDSGIGGLTVLGECMRNIPSRQFWYLGDNDNAPYGNLLPERIRELVFSAVERYASSVGALVLACNTATALCADELRKKYSFPVVGAEPAILPAVRGGGEVWVLATRATCESPRLQTLIGRALSLYPNARIEIKPCDTLAGVIERGIVEGACSVTAHLPKGNPSSVVLGCTHYVYCKREIERFYACPVYDGNAGITRRLACVLGVVDGGQKRFEPSTVTFLGNCATQNERVFEQMFARKMH